MAKGVSAAEKKERMLKLFRESKDVFTKKEIESRSTKVGIISNAVEGVLKELVGDDLVREEKVGISTYWWSFPGEDAAKKRRELSEQQAAVAELTPKLEQLQQQKAAAAAAAGGEGDASELQALEASIDALRGRQKAAAEELTKLTKHGSCAASTRGAMECRSRAARTGYRSPAHCTHLRRRAAWHCCTCAVRVPASGVPYAPRTVWCTTGAEDSRPTLPGYHHPRRGGLGGAQGRPHRAARGRQPVDRQPVHAHVQTSRPEASANAPSSTPRQRQSKRRAACSLGQPRPVSRDLLAGQRFGLGLGLGLGLCGEQGR